MKLNRLRVILASLIFTLAGSLHGFTLVGSLYASNDSSVKYLRMIHYTLKLMIKQAYFQQTVIFQILERKIVLII